VTDRRFESPSINGTVLARRTIRVRVYGALADQPNSTVLVVLAVTAPGRRTFGVRPDLVANEIWPRHGVGRARVDLLGLGESRREGFVTSRSFLDGAAAGCWRKECLH
jgi:hypothetical protein